MRLQDLNYVNLPKWLESNFLFRRLFLFRKLFLTKVRRSHYSQFAEDISIGRLFSKTSKGFFVDVGCFHPKKYNNTWMLYKRGWRGINIDIDSIKIDGFNWLRSEDTNVQCAVSDEKGEFVYWSNGFYSLTTSLDEDFVKNRTGYVKKTVACRTLNEILDESKYSGRAIDFLSVDAEGHDLHVLKSLDFNRYRPRLIAVETHFALMRDVSESDLYRFLVNQGYCLVGWSGLTLLLASKELQEELVASQH